MADDNVCPLIYNCLLLRRDFQEIKLFTYNGVDPSTAYNLLWEDISGHDVAEDVAKEGHPCLSSRESRKNSSAHDVFYKARLDEKRSWTSCGGGERLNLKAKIEPQPGNPV